MIGSSAAVVLAMLVVVQDPKGSPGSTPAAPTQDEKITVAKGLAALDQIRIDALRTLNHYATEGADTTTDRMDAHFTSGPMKYGERHYYRYHDMVDKALREFEKAVAKVVPKEPISKDVRGFFGDASLSQSEVHTRRRSWAEERMRGYDPAWLDVSQALKTFAGVFTTRDGRLEVDAEYGRGWQRGGGKPCRREREAEAIRTKLRAELERRLEAYFDDAREALLALDAGK